MFDRESIINIRPSQNNRSMIIQDPKIKECVNLFFVSEKVFLGFISLDHLKTYLWKHHLKV
jgi:hypothetical protein